MLHWKWTKKCFSWNLINPIAKSYYAGRYLQMKSLFEIHQKIDRFMSTRQGFARIPGHFILFAFPPTVMGWLMSEHGVGPAWLLLLAWPFAAAGIILILWLEIRDIANKKHDLKKALLDAISKLAGWLVGIATWQLWF
jgi:hypothetical protein